MRILMVSQLFVKSIGKAMKPWYKQIAQNSHLPSGIRSYDIVEGFSALKGNFKITSYKNLEGKLLYRTSEYADMGLITNKRFVYDDYLTYIETKTNQSGVLTRNEYKTFCNYDDGSVVELTEQIASTPLLDKQMVRYLKPGQSPRVINIDRPWGNAKMTSPNCTSKRLLMFNDGECLPTLISNRSKERISERIESIEKILANRNHLPISRTETQRVSQRVLNPEYKINEKTVFGDCDWYQGKVRIWDELYTTPDLYETMGHEFNHSKWLQTMNDVEMQKIGIGSRGKYIKARKLLDEAPIMEQIPYKERTIEDLAFAEEPRVKQKFWENMFDNIKFFFDC